MGEVVKFVCLCCVVLGVVLFVGERRKNMFHLSIR